MCAYGGWGIFLPTADVFLLYVFREGGLTVLLAVHIHTFQTFIPGMVSNTISDLGLNSCVSDIPVVTQTELCQRFKIYTIVYFCFFLVPPKQVLAPPKENLLPQNDKNNLV